MEEEREPVMAKDHGCQAAAPLGSGVAERQRPLQRSKALSLCSLDLFQILCEVTKDFNLEQHDLIILVLCERWLRRGLGKRDHI